MVINTHSANVTSMWSGQRGSASSRNHITGCPNMHSLAVIVCFRRTPDHGDGSQPMSFPNRVSNTETDATRTCSNRAAVRE
jgi:hypothetical protein